MAAPQTSSNSPAAPMPPAVHMETTTQRTPRFLPSIEDAQPVKALLDRTR